MTAILHRGLRNCFSFFYASFTFSNFYLDFYSPFLYGLFFPFLFGLLFPFSIWIFFFPFSIWTFISLLYLDFFFFVSTHFNSFQLVSTRFNSFQLNRGHILDFFQIFFISTEFYRDHTKKFRHFSFVVTIY